MAAGDSLTAGFGVLDEESYPAQLEQRIQAAGLGYRVVNAGSSGETSSGLLSRLEWLMTLKPAIVILATGANDGLRGLDPALNLEDGIHPNGQGYQRVAENLYPTLLKAIACREKRPPPGMDPSPEKQGSP